MPRIRKDFRITELQARREKNEHERKELQKERITLARTLWAEGWTREQLIKGMHTIPNWLKDAVPELYEENKPEEPEPPTFNNWLN